MPPETNLKWPEKVKKPLPYGPPLADGRR